MVGELQIKRFLRALGLLFVVAFYISFSFQNAFAASGITYTGRIFKGDQPLDSGVVRFDVWVKTKDNCVLYYERRNIDMTGSSGTYSFEIGDANIIPGTQSFPQSGIQTIGDIFNNAKSRANGDVDTSLPCSTFNPASDEGRLMTVSFTPQGETAQALPDLAITAVPTAFQAFNANKVNGYGTGDLLKVDSSVNKTTYANNALSQAQYDEFWKLILGTSTTYLKAIPTLGGDVTGTLPAVTVTKIQNIAVTAPLSGDTGKVLTYNGTGMVWSAAAAGGITTLNGLTGTSQSFISGTTPLTITSSGSAHTFDITNASSSASGLLTQADWNTFNSKQSGTLANGQVWIGNASNGAQAQTLSGDATVSASGNVTVDKTQTAQASKILQLDSSGNAYVAGVDIKGTGATAKLRFTGSTDMVMNLPTTSGTANQFLQTDGAGNLSWGSQSAMLPTISAGQVWVGNASNGAQAFSLTGDIASVSSTGVVTLSSSATGSNKLPLAGGTMSGAINMGGNNITNAGDVSLAAGKFLGLGVGTTAGTVTGQMWYDSGIIKYFDGTSVQSLGVAGAGITSFNGLTSNTQSLAIGTSGTVPTFNSSGSTHTLNIPMASSATVTAGLLSNADYASMMAKQSNALPSTQVWVGNASGAAAAVSLSGDIASVTNAGVVTVNKTTTGQANYILALDGTGVANVKGLDVQTGTGKVTLQTAGAFTNYVLTLPAGSPAANQIMKSDASGNLSWVTYLANVSDSVPLTNGKMWIGNASGIASEVTMSGDATITNAGLLALKSVGTVGTYWKVITDAQGRVTSGSALASGDVTTALGYTPTAAGSGYVNGGNAFGANATIGLTDNFNLGFKTNNSTRMTIDNAGNVGIGTTAPNAVVEIKGPSGGVGGDSFRISNSGGQTYFYAFSTADTSANIGAWSSAGSERPLILNEGGTANVGIGSASAGSMLSVNGNAAFGSYAASAAPANSIIVSGKVGIGTTSPSVALDVGSKTDAIRLPAGNTSQRPTNAAGLLRWNTTNSNVEYNDGSGWNAVATSSGSSGAYINGGNTFAGNATIGLNDNYNLGFKTNNTTKMTLTSDGKLGIGTTTPNTALAIASGDITLDAGYSMMWGQSAYSFINGDSGPSSHLILGTSGAIVMTLDVNGNVGIGTNPAFTLDMGSRTDAVRLPQGTTAQQPANTKGLIRFNTTSNTVEYNNGSAWVTVGSSLGYTPVNKAGDTMSGDLNTQNINIAAGKFLGLGAGSTAGTVAGQMWYDSGVIKYFDGTSAQSLGVAGAGITSLNGLTSNTQSFVIGTSGNAPAFSSAGSAHTLNIPMASASGSVTAGLISNADYASMMAKQSNALVAGQMWVGNASGAAQAFSLSGDVASVSNTGSVTVNKTTTGQSNYIMALDGSGIANAYGVGVKGATSGTVTLQSGATTANYSLTFPVVAPVNNQILQSNGSGVLSWVSNAANVNNAASLSNGKIWLGNASNIAVEQTMSGDATISNAGLLSLKNTGTVGTYFKVVTDAQGRVASGAALASGDVTTALGYTPTSAGSGYVNGGNTFGGNATLGLNDAYTLGFETNNTTRMTIDGIGNVGIGTTTPNTKLSVVDTGTDAAISISRPAAKEGILAFATGSLPRWELLATNAVESGSNAGSNFAIDAYDDAGSLLRTDFYINRATGKIGIGTMGPTVSLDLSAKTDAVRLPVGNTSQQPANATGLIRYNTTNSNVEFNNGSGWSALATGSGAGYVNGGNSFAGNATIGLNDSYTLGFKTNNATQMTLTAAGRLGIGTVTPSGTLEVQGGTAAASTTGAPITLKAQNGGSGGATGGSINLTPGDGTSGWPGGTVVIATTDGQNGGLSVNNNTTNSYATSGGSSAPTYALRIANNYNANGNTALIDGTVKNSSALFQEGYMGFVSVTGAANYSPDFILGLQNGLNSYQERLRVVGSTGNVGIGTSSPAYSLDFNGKTDAIRLPAGTTAQQPTAAAGLIRYNTSNSNIEFNNGSAWTALATGSGAGYVNGGNSFAGNATIGLNDAYTLGFETGGTTRMTLDASGNIGIGTTTPKGRLHIKDTTATGSAYSALVVGDDAGTHVGYDFDGLQAYNNASNSILYLNYWGGDVGFGDASKIKFNRSTNNIEGNNGGGIVINNGGTITTNSGNISSTSGNIYSTSGKIGAGGAPTYSIDAGTNTDALRLPRGTTAQQPANAAGLIRYNTSNNNIEYNNGSGWSVVATSSGSSGAYVNGGNSYAGNATIGLNDAYTLGLKTGGSTRMTIDASGNIGIGTTTPYGPLHIHHATSPYQYYTSTANPNGAVIGADANTFYIYQKENKDFAIGTNNLERMRVLANGNVGIGTTNPAAKLDVVGSAAFEDNSNTTTGAFFSFWKSRNYGAVQINDVLGYFNYYGSDGTSQQRAAFISSSVDNTVAAGSVPGNLVFATTQAGGTDSTERMRITSGGNVGINTAPTGNAKLEVNGTIVSQARSVASGATVNLAQGNTTVLASVGGSTITLQNMINGGNYTLVIQDTTSRTYTFSGCNTAKFSPANQATINGTPSIYNILTIYNGASFDCYITWSTGFQ